MTRIDYYLNAPNKSLVARKLAVKAFHAGKYTLMFTRDVDQIRELDASFWTSPILSFIPHVQCGHALANKSPVLIGADPVVLARPDVLINLAPEIPDCFARFDRMLEIVSEDEADKAEARKRFRYYKERGYAIDVHDLKALQ
jgi:DNA polymerase-3 subunit chi